MTIEKRKTAIIVLLFLAIGLPLLPFSGYRIETGINNSYKPSGTSPDLSENGTQAIQLDRIVSSIQSLSLERNIKGLQIMTDSLVKLTTNYYPDSTLLAELDYYIGVCKSLTGDNDAIKWFEQTISIKEKLRMIDEHYANSYYNIGVIYNNHGDLNQVSRYMLNYISLASNLYGENSSRVARAYSALIGASVGMQDYKKFPDYTFNALGILGKNKSALTEIEKSNLYQNIGTGYLVTGDYAKARLFLEEAETISRKNHMTQGEEYINLINSLAVAYGYLGLSVKETEYFNRGVELAVKNDSYLAFNMINTYVIGLGKSGKIKEGKILLSKLVEKSRSIYGIDSRNYTEALRNYADFLLNYKGDYAGAMSSL